MKLSQTLIEQCSLTLGQFDSERTNLLVTLFHHQNSCSQLTRYLDNLKDKFESLLTTKRDDDETYNDTPLTRIELATMIHFKQTFITNSLGTDEPKSMRRFSVEDELNLAYCFLLAQIDDRLKESHLNDLKLLFAIASPVHSLFDVFEKLGGDFSRFFSLLLQSKYFEKRVAMIDPLIQDFQSFIQRYEDFLHAFEKQYQPSNDTANNYSQTDAISNPNDTSPIMPLIPIVKIHEEIQPTGTVRFDQRSMRNKCCSSDDQTTSESSNTIITNIFNENGIAIGYSTKGVMCDN